MQGQINNINAQQFRVREELDALYYEVIHNLVLEVTRLGIETKNLKMRLESLTSRMDFDERRARALEGVVQYKPGTGPSREPRARRRRADFSETQQRHQPQSPPPSRRNRARRSRRQPSPPHRAARSRCQRRGPRSAEAARGRSRQHGPTRAGRRRRGRRGGRGRAQEPAPPPAPGRRRRPANGTPLVERPHRHGDLDGARRGARRLTILTIRFRRLRTPATTKGRTVRAVKLAIVVQRYGADINGGAELHARYVAEHLARHAQVDGAHDLRARLRHLARRISCRRRAHQRRAGASLPCGPRARRQDVSRGGPITCSSTSTPIWTS